MNAVFVLPVYLLGLMLIFLAERTLVAVPRLVLDATGGLSLVLATMLALRRWYVARKTHDTGRTVAFAATARSLIAASFAIGLYVFLALGLGHWLKGAQVIASMLWPSLLMLALLPSIALEYALYGMQRAPVVETWRLGLASRAARIMVLALFAFAGFNFAFSTYNRKVDLSYFKTTRVGDATKRVAQHLTAPVEIVLFFPPGNDVLQQVRAYAEELLHQSRHISLQVVDQALAPELAQRLHVKSNGYIALASQDQQQLIAIELDSEQARATLRSLDVRMHERLVKLIRPKRTVYLTTGHMERDMTPASGDKRPGLGEFKRLCESQGLVVKRLGLAEGLGNMVPQDASLVGVIGPTEALSQAERDTLIRFVNTGGSMLVAVDPEHKQLEPQLLAHLGVKALGPLVANGHYLVRLEGRQESAYNLVTTRISGHPSVATLEQNPGRMGVVLLSATGLVPVEQAQAPWQVTPIIHAMPQSFADTNGNGKFDVGQERYDNFSFAHAIERHGASAHRNTSTAKSFDAQKTNDSAHDDASAAADVADQAIDTGATGRAVVIGDADALTNGILHNPGNAYLVADVVRWLLGHEDEAGLTENEEDVPLVHRKEADALWFYGTSFIVPAVVLAAGAAVRRGGQRPRPKSRLED